MGLYCTHGAFRGSCGSFDRLRQFLLESTGGLWMPNCIIVLIKKFIDGCRLKYKNNESLEFG